MHGLSPDSGNAAAKRIMKSRRLIQGSFPRPRVPPYCIAVGDCAVRHIHDGHVRFGSKADIGEGAPDVRFTPESGHCPMQYSPSAARPFRAQLLVQIAFGFFGKNRKWVGSRFHHRGPRDVVVLTDMGNAKT
jgi:hypothetical protein